MNLPAATSPGFRRFGLKAQLLALLFSLNLLTSAAYSWVLYDMERQEILTGVDERLLTAAQAVREIVPDSYHAGITGPQSVSAAQFDALQYRLSRFANRSGLVYAYTYMKFGDQIHTVATSAKPDEVANGTQTKFFAHYSTAPAPLYESFADGRVRFDQYHDSFGQFRSVYVPVRLSDGRRFVVGIDDDLLELDNRLNQAFLKAVAVGVAMFLFAMVLGSFLISRMVSPLVQLTSYTRNIVARSFLADDADMSAMQDISQRRRDEVGSMAEAMTSMIGHLQHYLLELQMATAARERVEGELTAARDIQISMVPRTFPPFPYRSEIDIHAALEPAREVGGDFYDYELIDKDKLFFVIGDVAGKGVPSALFMAMTTTLFKAYADPAVQPGEIMARVNDELARDNPAEMFVTAFCGVLDLSTGTLLYSDGGHEAPYIRSATGDVSRLPKLGGMALGVFDGVPYTTGEVQLEPGAALVSFTDGVSEATAQSGALFTCERIATTLQQAGNCAPDALAQVLTEALASFVGDEPQSDDIAILAIRYNGTPQPR